MSTAALPIGVGAVGHSCSREEKSILEINQGGTKIQQQSYGEIRSLRGGTMDTQQYCLKWNSFGNNLATAFSNLFKSESLTDVTLFCEGVTFKAHRLILAACSKHFQELFEGMPPSPAGLIVILDGTSSNNMTALLEFMYRGEVHVSQESLSSFLKAAECLQVKGLSIEHEKLAVTQRHATTESNKSSTTESTASTSNGSGVVISNGDRASSERSGISCSGGINSLGNEVGGCASAERDAINVTEAAEAPENGLARGIKRRTPTPAPLSPPSNYAMPNMTYSAAHYYDSPQKRIMRSPSEFDSLHRDSVLRDGAAFRPASAPHQLLLENHLYSSFSHPMETPNHPHTAPHTPTELKQELERERSVERGNGEIKENVAEDLRIKVEPISLPDRDRVDKLTERLSGEFYSGDHGFESVNYSNSTEHLSPHSNQINLQSVHPPTPGMKPTPAMWNSKIDKAGTVSTPDGKKLKCPFCERLYGYETNLRAHIRQRHQGIRVPCPYCARTFTRNNTVRRHIAREHKPEQNLKIERQSAPSQVLDATVQQ